MGSGNCEMSEPVVAPFKLASPANLREAPHWHSREVLGHVHGITLVALLPLIAAGVVLFGWGVLLYVGVTIVFACLTELLICKLTNRRIQITNGHTVVLATILALAVPPHCDIATVAVGAALMVVAKEIFGGLGHYLWHPVLVARAILCFAFPLAMTPDYWPVLNRDHIILGNITNFERRPGNLAWHELESEQGAHAWLARRPVALLTAMYYPPVREEPSPAEPILRLIRDRLPPMIDCLLGTTAGGIGETSVVAILLGGVFLVYRGYVHWTLPICAVLGMIVTAGILPIPGAAGGQAVGWWPFRLLSGSPALPVGMMSVGYHLIVGEFMFAVFFVASDMTASPMRARGHVYYGLGIGGLTVALRLAGFATGAAYWAILIMNTFIPAIDRLTRRRVYGT